MSQNAAVPTARVAPAPVPLRELLPWALFAGVLLLGLLYLVGLDQGATSLVPGSLIHEFVHDGRHLLGVPVPLGSPRWSAPCSSAGCWRASPPESQRSCSPTCSVSPA